MRRLSLCIILLFSVPSVVAIEVIINANEVEQLKGVSNLRSIFTIRTLYWPNGEKIRVYVLPDDHELHKAFVKEKLHMFPHQLRRTWNRMTYTGTGQPPVTVNSVAEMLEKIKSTKNSIGYIGRRVEDEAIHFFDAQ